MRSRTILVAALVVVVLGSEGAQALYHRLNNYLMNNVKTDEVGANMEAAAKWLEGQDSVQHSCLSTTPVKDLKRFTALQQVVDDTTCDHIAYDIMSANEKAVGLHVLLLYRQDLRRVEKVMLEIFENHAKRCAKVYPVTYRTLKLELDAVQFERAKKYAQTLIDTDRLFLVMNEKISWHYPLNLFYLHRYIKHFPTFGGRTRRTALSEALKYNARKDPDYKYLRSVLDEKTGKEAFHKDKIKGLVKKYLIEPCKHVVDFLGPDLFIPARFDLPFYSEIDEQFGDYYLGWSYFAVCQALVKDEKSLYNEVTKYVVAY